MKKLIESIVAAAAAALLFLIVGCGESSPPYAGPALPYTPEPAREKQPNPRVALETSAGRIELELFEDETPLTVNNFVNLVEKKFYDGTKFHRLVKDFMIQGGDPQGTGSGGPGYRFPDEIKPTNHLVKYSLAMANSGPNTNGSQFFIMTGDQPRTDLDKKHTVFGKVIAGQDVVDRLNVLPVEQQSEPNKEISKPKEEIKLIKAEALYKRNHKYEPWNTTPAPTVPPPSAMPKISPRPPGPPPKPGEKTQSIPLHVTPPTPPVTPPAVPPEKKAEEKKAGESTLPAPVVVPPAVPTPAPSEKKAEERKAGESTPPAPVVVPPAVPTPAPAEKKAEEKKAEEKK
jgi:cyclophilin family peptidyl-prolyl cis-trans isomerase